MCSNNMTCTIKDKSLEIIYACGPAEKAVVDHFTGIITFIMRDGGTICANITKHVFPETAYLQQFGICITEDGELFFVQSWEKGLYCFELQTGLLRWHYKRKKAYDLVVGKYDLICHFLHHSIEKLDLTTGEVVAHIPMGYGTNFHVLTNSLFLVGPKRKKYSIIDHNLCKVAEIPAKAMNPNAFDSFMITKAFLSEEGLLISGYEYSIMNVKHLRENGKHLDSEEFLFYRIVPIDAM